MATDTKPDAKESLYEDYIFCNHCNARRPLGVHPCLECRCPEYRLVPKVAQHA